jgi:hypothetical protein
MYDFALDLGFDSTSDLLGESEVLFSYQDLNWYLTKLQDDRWVAWNSLDSITKTFKSFTSYDEAKEYFVGLYYSFHGYPLHLAKVGYKVSLKCEYCHSNMTFLFAQENENIAWLSCPHFHEQDEIHESLAVPLSMTSYSG